MAESFLKWLWNTVKPPPPVPHRASPQSQHERSGVQRFLDNIRPPPKVKTAAPELVSEHDRSRRKLLVRTTLAIVAAGVAGWGTYAYISSAPSRAEKVLQDGLLLAGKGDFKGAEDSFSRSVSIWPQMASGYLQRGLVRRSLKNMDGAVEDFEHSIELDPMLLQAHTELGVIYRDRGDLTRSVNEYTISLQIAPSPDAYYQRGQVYESLGQHDKAIADYDEAIHEQPDAPYVYRARAVSREKLGNGVGAEADRAQALQIEHRL